MAEAAVALGRISKFLVAEELVEDTLIDYSGSNAINVDGDFIWEAADKPTEKSADADADPSTTKKKSDKEANDSDVLPTTSIGEKEDSTKEPELKEDEQPFEFKDLKLTVPKGSFVALVGRVGSGKVLVVSSSYKLY